MKTLSLPGTPVSCNFEIDGALWYGMGALLPNGEIRVDIFVNEHNEDEGEETLQFLTVAEPHFFQAVEAETQALATRAQKGYSTETEAMHEEALATWQGIAAMRLSIPFTLQRNIEDRVHLASTIEALCDILEPAVTDMFDFRTAPSTWIVS